MYENGYIAMPLLTTIIAVIGLIGNVIVVWVQIKFACKTKHTTLVTSLAVCDMSFAVLVLIYYVPKLFTTRWIYGSVGCKIIGSAVTVGAWVAVGIILNIAIERFCGIVYPLRRGLTRKRMYMALTVNVCLAVCFVVPRFMYLRHDFETLDCRERYVGNTTLHKAHAWSPRAYDWSVFIIYFLAPVFTISILYFKIFQTIKKSMKRCEISGRTETGYIERIRRNRKVTTLLVAVLAAFVLCTLPKKIRWLMRSSGISNISNPYFTIITETMYSIHLSINPFIYTATDKQFRRSVIKLRPGSLLRVNEERNEERRQTELFVLNSVRTCQNSEVNKEEDEVR